MTTIILSALLFWVLYNLIVKFIIPVYNTSRHIKNQFNEMKEKFEGNGQSSQTDNQKPTERVEKGDYIDFEEVKE